MTDVNSAVWALANDLDSAKGDGETNRRLIIRKAIRAAREDGYQEGYTAALADSSIERTYPVEGSVWVGCSPQFISLTPNGACALLPRRPDESCGHAHLVSEFDWQQMSRP